MHSDTFKRGRRGKKKFNERRKYIFNFSISLPPPCRQCMCCFREIKNYERFNLIVQSLICLTVNQLKSIQQLLDNRPSPATPLTAQNPSSSSSSNKDGAADSDSTETATKTAEVEPAPSTKAVIDPNAWTLSEVERLLILVSKAFLLNFPLYIAYKHGVHSRLDDITAQEAQVGPFLETKYKSFSMNFIISMLRISN